MLAALALCLAAAVGADAADAVRYRDGERWIEARRLDDAAAAWARSRATVARREPTAYVELRQGAPFSPFVAGIDARAVVSLRDPHDAEARLVALGLEPLRALLPSRGVWLVEGGRDEDGLDLAARLSAAVSDDGPLRAVSPDLYLRHRLAAAPFVPDDPLFADQWFFEALELPAAWALEQGSASVTIVIVDNGCDASHPDLRDKLLPGKDVIDLDDDPSYAADSAGNEHGTATAGLAAASTDNGRGVAGACPGCRLSCVRLLPEDGALVPISADVAAFQFAIDIGAAVISNSWGFDGAMAAPRALADAIDAAFTEGRGGRGALVVFASGNDDRVVGEDEVLGLPGVLGVGALDSYGQRTQYSNTGPALDVVSPLGNITTDIVGAAGGASGDYTRSFGGTSSACPIVAGVAGLLVSAAPELGATELTQALLDTARLPFAASPDARGHDDEYGFGVIDAAAALSAVGATADEPEEGGCTCAASTPRQGALFALLAAVAALVRRRQSTNAQRS